MVDIFARYTAWLHVRFEGRSLDLRLADLDLGPLSPDRDVKAALARYLNIPDECLSFFVIERHANGNLTVRPQMIFG